MTIYSEADERFHVTADCFVAYVAKAESISEWDAQSKVAGLVAEAFLAKAKGKHV